MAIYEYLHDHINIGRHLASMSGRGSLRQHNLQLYSTPYFMGLIGTFYHNFHYLQALGIAGTMTDNESAEYKTVIVLTDKLRLAVRPELISLTGSLLASRLISLDNDIELRDTAHSSEVERSARLVELVQNKVRQNPRHYHTFIGILQGNEDQYRDILQQLEQIYKGHEHEEGKSPSNSVATRVIVYTSDIIILLNNL